MNSKFLNTIQTNNMLDQADTVLCCVSGGADSMALLSLFMENKSQLNIDIRVCHVNHMLRGDESDRDQLFVENFCKENNIPIDVLKTDVENYSKEKQISIELGARQVRYEFFNNIAQKYKCKIATAHTMSDNVETIIFNMARGTGIDGLLGIPCVRENIIRPIIMYERGEIEAYLSSRNICYVTDSTNEQTVYTRNKIRHNIIPKLKEVNSKAVEHINETAQQLYHVNGFIKGCAKNFDNEFCNKGKYSIEELCKLHVALRQEVIVNSLEKQQININSYIIKQIDNIIIQGYGKINLTKNWFAVVKNGIYNIIYLENHNLDFNFEVDAIIGKNYVYSEKTIVLQQYESKQIKNLENVHVSKLKNMIDYDRVEGQLVFRNRKTNDKVKFFRRGLTKNLKKLFNESKIPLDKRNQIAILCDDIGIVWVEGFGISERVACCNSTKKYLEIEVIIWEEEK